MPARRVLSGPVYVRLVERSPLLSALHVHFALYLKLDSQVKGRHTLLEGLEIFFDVSERCEQLQPFRDLLQACHPLRVKQR